jgi:hypothetical protein
MKHNIEFKHFEPAHDVRELVEELISRLERELFEGILCKM